VLEESVGLKSLVVEYQVCPIMKLYFSKIGRVNNETLIYYMEIVVYGK